MDELEISGKRFLSTRRAAKEHKYHSDYIGQLIRAGKVIGKKVGRSWYVEESSLNAYLAGEVEEPKAPETVMKEVIVKKEEETPVEPLAVAEVGEEKIVEEVTPVAPAITEPAEIKIKVAEEYHVPIHAAVIKNKKAGGLRYIADDAPMLPETRKRNAAVATAIEDEPLVYSAQMPEEEYSIENKKIGARSIAGLALVGVLTIIITAAVSITVNSHLVVVAGQVATVSYTLH